MFKNQLDCRLGDVIFSEEEIQARLKEVGQQITKDYEDKQDDGIVVLCILKGAAVFMADLVRYIDLALEIDFMCVSSYGNEMKSSGKINIKLDTDQDIIGKHIIIAEDIVDSGQTLEYVTKHLKNRGAKDVSICAFLDKHVSKTDIDVNYCCFDCPDDFIVGYGLDYAQHFRHLPYISSVICEDED